MAAAYGAPVPFPVYHPTYYAHASMAAGVPHMAGEAAATAAAVAEGKSSVSPSGEEASGSGDGRSEEFSEKRDADADQMGSSSAKRRKSSNANAEGNIYGRAGECCHRLHSEGTNTITGTLAGEMIVGPAKALFMDEISTGLDSSTTYQIFNSIKPMVHILEGTAVIALLQPDPETYEGILIRWDIKQGKLEWENLSY